MLVTANKEMRLTLNKCRTVDGKSARKHSMNKTPMPFRYRQILLTGFLLIALCLTSVFTPAAAKRNSKPFGRHSPMTMTPEIGLEEKIGVAIPLDATFRDEQGQPVTLSELITVPTLIVPVYFNCPNVCHFLQKTLAQGVAEIRLTPDRDYRVLSISFNERETAVDARKARQTYRKAMNAAYPAEAWRFLTGDETNIHRLLDAAGYRFARREEYFLHPVAIFAVTADGRIVRYLHGTRPQPLDITLALTEASQGYLDGTIRKIVQFFFNYDPGGQRYVFNLMRASAVVVILMAGGFVLYLLLSGRKKTKD